MFRAPLFLAAFFQFATQLAAAEQAKLDRAFELVRTTIAQGEIPGAVALVMKDGKIIREEAYGLADVEHKAPFTPETICWIASITKPVTVAAAMKLVEEGKLDLGDKVEKYIPEFARQKDKAGQHHAITILHLMCHTSGLQANPPLRPSFLRAGVPGPQDRGDRTRDRGYTAAVRARPRNAVLQCCPLCPGPHHRAPQRPAVSRVRAAKDS